MRVLGLSGYGHLAMTIFEIYGTENKGDPL
jgi:hypothetical protein